MPSRPNPKLVRLLTDIMKLLSVHKKCRIWYGDYLVSHIEIEQSRIIVEDQESDSGVTYFDVSAMSNQAICDRLEIFQHVKTDHILTA